MKLIIEDDDGRKTVVPFVREEISIGRKDGNTIRLTERNVSRRHARLLRANGHVFIEDLGSYNGVRVNGDAVTGRAEIQEGDLIEIGDYNLAVQIEAGELVGSQKSDGGEGVTRPVNAPAPMPSQPAQPQAAQPPPRPAAPSPAPAQPQAQPAPQRQAAPASPPQPKPAPAAAPAPKPAPAEATPAPQQAAEAAQQAAGAPPRREATAVIRVDIDALNRRADQRSIPPQERPRVVALSTEYAGRSFEIGKATVGLGRTEDNDIPIDHRSMSRNHCKIYRDHDDGLWKIADLGSANGVRVNGEDYGLIDLRAGDVIELGHVKLRWCEPGDDFVYTPEAAESAAAPTPSPAHGGAAKSKGLSPVVLGLGGLVLVGALAGGAWMFLGGEDPAPTPEPQAGGEAKAGAAAVAEAIRQAVQEAGDAVQSEDWDAAKAAYQRVLALDAGNAAATSGLERVSAEAEARGRYEAALAAMKGEQWDEALQAFQAIPDSSIYHERAATHVQDARGKQVTALADQAQDALKAKQWDEALESADAVLALAPDHAGAASVRDRAQKMLDREAARRAKDEERRRRDEERRKAREERRRQQAEKTAAAKVQPVEAAPQGTAQARESFDLGYRLIQKRKYKEAIPPLEKALRLDPTGQSKAHALLGTAYANLGNSQQAAKHYRRFLQTNPNHPQAPQVKKILEEFEKYNKQ